MSRINMLQLGTLGVDLRTNPLLLGNKKLHSSTNMVFEEGVLKTRPGFRYCPSGASGQFQGACEFRPQRGISSGTFSDVAAGVLIAAGGSIYFGGSKVASDLFTNKGEVNMYQAENYAIIQNIQTSTYWWDGNLLTKSPGMLEQDWNDPDTPLTEVAFVAPVAEVVSCENLPDTYLVDFLVLDKYTEEPISYPTWNFKANGTVAYEGVGASDGTWEFIPVKRSYKYNVYKSGYEPKEGVEVEIVGTESFVVRLTPLRAPMTCGVPSAGSEYAPYAEYEVDLGTAVGEVVFTYDTGEIPCKFVLEWDGVEQINTGYRGDISYADALYAAVEKSIVGPPEGTESFTKTTASPDFAILKVWSPLPDSSWLVTTGCPDPEIEPPAECIDCCYAVSTATLAAEGGMMYIENTGALSLTVVDLVVVDSFEDVSSAIDQNTLEQVDPLPYVLPPGHVLLITSAFDSETPPVGYTLTMTCDGDPIEVTGNYT